MQIFNTSNFYRQGNTEKDIKLNNNNEVAECALQLSTTALRKINIFTPDLEASIYNNNDFKKNLLHFVRGNRNAQIQILINNSDPAIKQGHRIIQLSQQITSALEIRNTPEDYQNENMSFLLIDQAAFLFKANPSKQQALQSNCKIRAVKLLDFFILAWEQAEQDPQTKRINL